MVKWHVTDMHHYKY